jgi:uncharacterized membrane protein YdfJ with MMPL/SSD domain
VFAALGRVVVRPVAGVLIARLREEAAAGHEPRAAADLTQMGVAVTVGIVLAAFVISVFLVPAVTALIGNRAWWPGRVDRPLAGHAGDADQLAEVEPTGNGSARSRSPRL